MVDNHPDRIDMKLIKATEKYIWDGIIFPVNLGHKQTWKTNSDVFGCEQKNVNVLRKSENYERKYSTCRSFTYK